MVNGYAQAVKRLWTGKCTITVLQHETDEANGRAKEKEVDLYTDVPCRISFDTVSAAETDYENGATKLQQTITLFLASDMQIPPGSKLTVTQNGVTGVYRQSGQPAVYSAHQEIPLELFKEWA